MRCTCQYFLIINKYCKWFQIRAYCKEYEENLSFSPYQCRIPFRDVVLIHLRSSYDGDRVTVHLSIESRRPPKYARYLPQVLSVGKEGVFERHITEADFRARGFETSEASAGPMFAVGDTRLAIDPVEDAQTHTQHDTPSVQIAVDVYGALEASQTQS
ncbi:hypothetical protein PHLGIDRAFT_466508 [Phlebiopsis gigantea 11061_1 CR5-6]|uniref:Uncharacterized protein n=1 Tax=Phlebiopsis gigantea (strain 11061_1 CR5-6) TaxID=745531 RepID=A0A0C3PJE3_PHLG1|nr:hypothetical protein PHLGIDRAFT_466508 [Phlebiopsis gigantea 11061_1 CR5-6]